MYAAIGGGVGGLLLVAIVAGVTVGVRRTKINKGEGFY